MSKTFSLSDVEKHNSGEDLWVVVHNKVYEVAKYMHDHPGGAEILQEVAGTDATTGFEDAGHSDDAREIMETMLLGQIAEEDAADTIEVYRPTFKNVGRGAAVALETSGKPRFSILGVLGGIAITAAGGFWFRNHPPTALASVVQSFKRVGVHNISDSGHSSFWIGIAVASAANIFLAAGAAIWVGNHMDVHEEFTKHLSHRAIRKDTIVQRKVKQAKQQRKSLDPQKWRQFTLTQKVKISPNVYRLTFGLNKVTDTLGLPIGQHVSVRANINEAVVQRSYTPISNDTDLGRLELCIKVYDKGLITNYLANLEIGEKAEFRGPKGAMTYSKTLAKNIGMIAGGTGITPMYQLIRAIVEDDSDKTKVSLLYANNTEEDILMRAELENFSLLHPEKFTIRHVLSHPPQGWSGLKGFISEQYIKEYLPAPAPDTKILLCGPPPMIEAEKKNLVNLGYEKARAMSKASDQVFCF